MNNGRFKTFHMVINLYRYRLYFLKYYNANERTRD